MDEVLGYAPYVVVALLLVLARRFATRRQTRVLRAAASRLGMRFNGSNALVGQRRSVTLRITVKDDGETVSTTFIASSPLLPDGLKLIPRGPGPLTWLHSLVSQPSMNTGDDEFDTWVHVEGEEHRTRSTLTADVRHRILPAIREGVTLADGEVQLKLASRVKSVTQVTQYAELCFTAAEALCRTTASSVR